MPDLPLCGLPTPLDVRQALHWAVTALVQADVESPRLDSEVLLGHVLRWTRSRLHAWPEQKLSNREWEEFVAAVNRRCQHEPVPYIIGHREFFGLDFVVDRRVLIPRPETELVVERVLETVREMGWTSGATSVADVGTGSGVIAVCVATRLPAARVYAIDSSPDALQVAATNVARLRVQNQIQLLCGNLLDPLPDRVQLLVANLPYVSTADLHAAARDVRDYEPVAALDGGRDGLDSIRKLLQEAPRCLAHHGVLLLEIGADQGPRVANLVQQAFPNARVEVMPDYAGFDRIVRVWS